MAKKKKINWHHKRIRKSKAKRHSFNEYLAKAGYNFNEKQIMRIFLMISVIFTVILPFIYVMKMDIMREGFAATAWVYFWIETLTFPLVYLLSSFIFLIFTDILMDARRVALEKVFPEFLHLTAANVRAGMPIDQALWGAVKPKFGILSKEIEVVAKKTMTGEDLTVALKDFSEKYKSKIIRSTISLINEGINAGSEIGDLLENVALSMEDIATKKDSMAANVTSNVIFITFSVIIAAPLLFAISVQLLNFVHTMGSSLGNIGGSGSQIGFSFSLSSDAVSTNDFLYFCYLSITLSSIMANIIIATIKTGRPADALKKIPGTIIISISLFLLAKWLLGKAFAGLV
jgi:pilus assembly protein TadC